MVVILVLRLLQQKLEWFNLRSRTRPTHAMKVTMSVLYRFFGVILLFHLTNLSMEDIFLRLSQFGCQTPEVELFRYITILLCVYHPFLHHAGDGTTWQSRRDPKRCISEF